MYALYLSQPSFHSLHATLIGSKFRRYCFMHQHVEIQKCLEVVEFRPVIAILSKSILHHMVSTLCDLHAAMSSPQETERRIATFRVLLNDPLFQDEVTKEVFLLAMNKSLDACLLEEMVGLSHHNILRQTLALYRNAQSDQLSADHVVLKIQMLEDAIAQHEALLNSVGRYVNRDVIICTELSRGDGSSFFKPFQRYEYDDGEYPFTTAELQLNALSRLIREKDNWREKCREPALQAKWRAEVASQAEQQHGEEGVRGVLQMKMFELALQQVQLLAQIGEQERYEASPVDGVYSSDSIVAPETLALFLELAEELQRTTPRDFHPGSGEQVVDIVHPSLYPLAAGVSRVRERPALSLEESWRDRRGGLGLPALPRCPAPPGEVLNDVSFSKQFQWLPAEFHVQADSTVHINSYINNLHPREHAHLYPVLAKIFSDCVPMMEQVLSDHIAKHPLRLIDNAVAFDMYPELCDEEYGDDTAVDEYYENRLPLDIPLPESFPVHNLQHYLQKNVSLRDKRLQVIVKLASTELSPDKPEYGGGAWHVEGMDNEGIVCTLIHYYSCRNITESRLSFRQAICEPHYEQGDDQGVQHRYALEDESPLNQELGHAVAKEGRSLAFPNLFQHRVEPFSLADRSRPGHRKILVYFVLDPLRRVLSSADVPPQQRSWMDPQHGDCGGDSEVHRLLRAVASVPDDVVGLVLDFLDFPVGRAAAELMRQQLMRERSFFVNEVNEAVYERPFSLCEH